MPAQQISIEEFRKSIQQQYADKGVLPPEPGSVIERELYEMWLKGSKKLAEL